ncbi:uncharacterized protein LOC110463824 [Mizuhopecten yessoensis]|uniref:uncharacterized protein LOC110463824 n=1 Tax=Mizuhopecten yessoensis TaxID=6573 RepID=UPI000B45A7A5|nr:uncharacterized protein LOC110463824 [Mizuhopecten yessoensis]
MGRAAFFSFLLLGLVAVSVRLAEAQDGECPPGVNLLRTCRCQTDGFGICWNQKCDLCNGTFRKKRSVINDFGFRDPGRRPRLPRPRRCRARCHPLCTCNVIGTGCCCPWTVSSMFC